MMIPHQKALPVALCLFSLTGLTAYTVIRHPVPRQPPKAHPTRLADDDQWMADHGRPDFVQFDYFDRLAPRWHLASPIGKGFAGWAHSDVECLTYIQSHVTVFFVRAAKTGADMKDSDRLAWKLFGCSDSRTGHLERCPLQP